MYSTGRYLEVLPQWVLYEREGDVSGNGGEVSSEQTP